MKLSVVIICWNDLRVIRDCLRSIYAGTHAIDFEVIISDNGSVDDSIEFVRKHYPQVRVVENQQNLGFARGNNAGIRASRGEYVLILNPDTIIHDGAFERLIEFAERHPEAGAFGCRVLNPDGTYQVSARLFPTIWRYWVSALGLSKLSSFFVYEEYPRWRGDTERSVDWQSGCCVMFRADLLKNLGGFDEQFFYHFEEVDLCRRVWNAGRPILFTPEAVITHLGGQSVGRFPVRFEIEKHRSRYRYFYKHFGARAARRCRRLSIAKIRVRQLGYGLLNKLKPAETIQRRLDMYREVLRWNKAIDPVDFVERGEEPRLEQTSVPQVSI
ncbi:MAG: glycosyltransferase family 2 protein [Candidatus Acidoferrum typicum]|nr:glycosyltransferase family 2 protein [Candidatus Acidoferrum typicum]